MEGQERGREGRGKVASWLWGMDAHECVSSPPALLTVC